MIFVAPPAILAKYLESQGAGSFHPDTVQGFVAVEEIRDNNTGEIIPNIQGAVAFYNTNTRNSESSIAISNPRCAKALISSGLLYAFGQLSLRRLTFLVAESNLKSIQLVTKLGARPEATLQDAAEDGNLLVFCLRPDECKLWSRINGQKYAEDPAGPGPGGHSCGAV